MDLLHKIEDLIRLGYSISFKNDINQFILTVSKLNKKKKLIKKEVYLPLDHLTEEKLLRYIQLLQNNVSYELG